ncbi:MAG: T9SS type A sorting domain-containing protein [Saprospiraceae bacterium]
MQKKNILVIFTLLAATVMLPAQIIITNATFPAAGDSLKTATDLAPTVIALTAPGGPQAWDFTSLNPSTRQVTVFQPAANGSAFASFPGAELVTINAVGAETYYDVSASAFSILGLTESGLGGGLLDGLALKYTPPSPERRAPTAFFDIHQSESNASIAISTAAIPAGILDSLGIPAGLFDSIRLRINLNRLEVVDGYGTLAIPGGIYDVLREKRTDYTSTAVDVHTFLGWVDISTIIGGQLPGFGVDTTKSYQFLSNTSKEPIAIATLDPTESFFQDVEYKDLGIPSAVSPVTSESKNVVVSPNPVSNMATFELKNIPSGKYTLRLYDANGQNVFAKELASDHETISLETLSSGIYYYQIVDAKNKIVAMGKMIKVNP